MKTGRSVTLLVVTEITSSTPTSQSCFFEAVIYMYCYYWTQPVNMDKVWEVDVCIHLYFKLLTKINHQSLQ